MLGLWLCPPHPARSHLNPVSFLKHCSKHHPSDSKSGGDFSSRHRELLNEDAFSTRVCYTEYFWNSPLLLANTLLPIDTVIEILEAHKSLHLVSFPSSLEMVNPRPLTDYPCFFEFLSGYIWDRNAGNKQSPVGTLNHSLLWSLSTSCSSSARQPVYLNSRDIWGRCLWSSVSFPAYCGGGLHWYVWPVVALKQHSFCVCSNLEDGEW